jgi:hypothetical protein
MSLETQVFRGRDIAQRYLGALRVERPSLDGVIQVSTKDLGDAEFIAFVEGFFGVLNEYEEAQYRRAEEAAVVAAGFTEAISGKGIELHV